MALSTDERLRELRGRLDRLRAAAHDAPAATQERVNREVDALEAKLAAAEEAEDEAFAEFGRQMTAAERRLLEEMVDDRSAFGDEFEVAVADLDDRVARLDERRSDAVAAAKAKRPRP